MTLRPMDPAIARKLLEGYQNELDPERVALDAFYRQFKCNACGSSYQKEILPHHTFSGDSLVPRSVLRCTKCRRLFDPHSGLVLETGTAMDQETGLPLVGQDPRF